MKNICHALGHEAVRQRLCQHTFHEELMDRMTDMNKDMYLGSYGSGQASIDHVFPLVKTSGRGIPTLRW